MNSTPCERCGGTGKVAMPEHLQTTLNLLPKKSTITAHMLNGKCPSVKTTAFSNRLRDLLDLGLVQREKRGRFWLYSRTQPKTN